jgi:hypothetical protein
MALSITGIENASGPGCSHLNVTVNHEGITRVVHTTLAEIDAMIGDMSQAERARMLVLLWAAYRRSRNRTIVGVNIA